MRNPQPTFYIRTSVLLPLLGILFLVIFPPRYGTNDDVAMLLIASGKMIVSAPDEHLLFTHAWYGLMLKHLYQWTASVPWYGIILIGCQFLAILSWGWVLPKRLTFTHICLITGVMLLYHAQLFQYLQFTSCSILLAQSAMVSLVGCAMKGTLSKWKWGFLLVTVLMAGMIRLQGMLLAGLLMAPLLGLTLWYHPKLRMVLLSPILPAVIGILAWQFNTSYYQQSSEWRDFYQKNELRAQFTDYDRFPYSEYRALYEEVGWREVDYTAYRYWFQIDTANLSLEDLTVIARNESTPNLSFHSKGLRLLGSFKLNFWVGILLLGLLLLLPFIELKDFSYQVLLLTFMWVTAIFLGLSIFKWIHFRISYPLFGTLLLTATLFLKDSWQFQLSNLSLSFVHWRQLLFLSFLFFALLVGGLQAYRGMRDVQKNQQVVSFIQQAPRDKPWMFWADSFPYEQLVLPLNEHSEITSKLSVATTAFMTYTPILWEHLDSMNIHSPVEQMKHGEIYVFAREEYWQLFLEYAKPDSLIAKKIASLPAFECDVIQFQKVPPPLLR